MRYLRILLLSLLCIGCFACFTEDILALEPVEDIQTLEPVSNRRLASVDAYPFAVYVPVPGRGYCSGTIVSPFWVLTAAHCVVGGNGQIVPPRVIEHGWNSGYGFTQRFVKQTVVHPEYDYAGAGFQHDMALLEVIKPFPVSYSAPLRLASRHAEEKNASSGTLATHLGHGWHEVYKSDFQHAQMRLLHAADCRNQFSFEDELDVVHDNTVCAGNATRMIRAGDSGAPLLVPYHGGGSGAQWLQVGVASMRARDPSGHPVVSVYTRVSSSVDWIDTVTQGNTLTD